MRWNDHSRDVPKGSHAFLSPSKGYWLRYSTEKLVEAYENSMAAEYGTKLHELAKTLIDFKQKLPRSNKTLNKYVNDAIGFGMDTEQVLYYSPRCYGTADAISFKNNFLRIHDYKSGKVPCNFDQLRIYAALFCLEYEYKPSELNGIELRLYQNDEMIVDHPDVSDILPIMDIIIKSDEILRKMEESNLV